MEIVNISLKYWHEKVTLHPKTWFRHLKVFSYFRSTFDELNWQWRLWKFVWKKTSEKYEVCSIGNNRFSTLVGSNSFVWPMAFSCIFRKVFQAFSCIEDFRRAFRYLLHLQNKGTATSTAIMPTSNDIAWQLMIRKAQLCLNNREILFSSFRGARLVSVGSFFVKWNIGKTCLFSEFLHNSGTFEN